MQDFCTTALANLVVALDLLLLRPYLLGSPQKQTAPPSLPKGFVCFMLATCVQLSERSRFQWVLSLDFAFSGVCFSLLSFWLCSDRRCTRASVGSSCIGNRRQGNYSARFTQVFLCWQRGQGQYLARVFLVLVAEIWHRYSVLRSVSFC